MKNLLFITLLGLSTVSVPAQGLNDQVMKIANSYEGGGYKWSSSGTPKSLYFKDTKILSKSVEGTFCSGYTFTVAFDVMDNNQLLDDLNLSTVKWLQRSWYGSTEESAESQCLFALKKLKIGTEVLHTNAKAGDFVQFWRNNESGHSVIFLDWIKNDSGEISGIKYRSTQRKTNGIGDRVETVGIGESNIDIDRLYIVRIKG
ncbi:MAG: hypothetical protein GY816_23475 [Cytophagales bacterium]|nr:hypothetical protein [Cytophagales bacterium]